ncbi:MAG: hypothetical protein OXE04_08470, partial [bacterium]|nr:hypothetical protein [bacterium]
LDGPDTPNPDNPTASETLTFTSINWDTAQTITVTGVDDDVDNPGDERSVTVTHAIASDSDSAYNALADKTVTVTVTDDDGPPVVSIADAAAVTEGNDTAATTDMTFTVTLSAVSGKPVTATYTLAGTAEAPADYTEPNPLSVTIDAGQTTGTITVLVKGDVVDEPNETIIVTLASATNATVSTVEGADTGTGTITDDDPVVSTALPVVSVVDATSVLEGDDPTALVDMMFTVILSEVSDEEVTVTYTLSGTAIAPADYTEPNQMIVAIPAGQSSATIVVAVRGDVIDEDNETVIVTLLSATNATIIGTQDEDETEDPQTELLQQGEQPVSPQLGEPQQGGFVYVVSEGLVADVRGFAGEVSSGVEHVGRWNRVLVAFGEDVLGFVGEPMGVVEAQGYVDRGWVRWEPVVVALKELEVARQHQWVRCAQSGSQPGEPQQDDLQVKVEPESTQQGAATGTGIIIDDDTAPISVTLSVFPASVAENVGVATSIRVTAVLGGTTTFVEDTEVTVKVGRAGDTAVSGTDYEAVGDFTVTIPGGSRSASGTFSLLPVDDNRLEQSETITVHGIATGLTVFSATVTITDNEEPVTPVEPVEPVAPVEPAQPVAPVQPVVPESPLKVFVGDASAVVEGDDPDATVDMVFTVALSRVSSKDVTVIYALGGTATGGVDYIVPALLRTVIPAGNLSSVITVPVKGDTLIESDETVVVTLLRAFNAQIA